MSEGQAFLLAVENGPIEMKHPGGGWPEFTITLRYYVTSDDMTVVQGEQQRLFESDWRLAQEDEE